MKRSDIEAEKNTRANWYALYLAIKYDMNSGESLKKMGIITEDTTKRKLYKSVNTTMARRVVEMRDNGERWEAIQEELNISRNRAVGMYYRYRDRVHNGEI